MMRWLIFIWLPLMQLYMLPRIDLGFVLYRPRLLVYSVLAVGISCARFTGVELTLSLFLFPDSKGFRLNLYRKYFRCIGGPRALRLSLASYPFNCLRYLKDRAFKSTEFVLRLVLPCWSAGLLCHISLYLPHCIEIRTPHDNNITQ